MQRAYFITATGTDLGKTWLTAGLAHACRARGVAVRAVKPVMSGYDAANPQASDAGILLGLAGVTEGNTLKGTPPRGTGDMKLPAGVTPSAVAEIAPWRFAAPLSPDRAAALEDKHIDFDELVAWCRAQIAAYEGTLLIEGIGGVMVPLTERHTVREWIAALGIPVVLVAGSYLGALSHTLTALAALREAGIVPAVVVLNESAGSSVNLDDAAASLVPHLGSIPLFALRYGNLADIASVAAGLAAGNS